MPETNDTVTLTIDGREITVPAGTTILEAARQLDQDIPAICFHDATTPKGLCRMCVVDVDNGRVLQPACVTPCADGTEVEARSPRVDRSRRTILEMLHAAVNLDQAPEIQTMLETYDADPQRFPEAERRNHPVIDDNPFYVRDYSQCVLCWRCVQVCAEDAQYTYALTFEGRGYETRITTSFDVPLTDSACVFCGQCIGVCPTGALKPKIEWGLEQGWDAEQIRASTRRPRKRRESNITGP